MSNDDRPVLLIDAMNLFVRSYCAYPSMSSQGHQTGGVVGFLKTLRKICSDFHPQAVYVCWEGGGSLRRRNIYSEYKTNRKPEKLNRFYEDDIPDTDENKVQQIAILAGLLAHLPVCQVYVENCEGDDIIAYLAKYKFQDSKKIIVSSDKDFYQLLNDKTQIYSLHKKTIVTAEMVLDEFRIATHNFALAKAICGDTSDNIPGVDGLGFKTLAKKFPIFSGEHEILIENVIDYSQTNLKTSSCYKKVIENEPLIRRNWQLVYLDTSAISSEQISRIEYVTSTFKPVTNKIGFIKRLVKEGIVGFEVDKFFLTFLGINLPS